MICQDWKIGGAHVYFKTCWEDIITAGMADPFVIGLAVKMTVQTYAVVRGILGFIFTLLIIATAYCYHDWAQVAFLFSLSVILYLILFAGVFVDTVLDMTRERIIDFIIS